MHGAEVLKDLVVILAAAVAVVAVLRKLGVPSIAGFIVTGALIGPGALGLVDDTEQVRVLAEVGVVLLLFGIGLELSLSRLRRLWKVIVLGGGLQVSATVILTSIVAMSFDLPWTSAVFLGCVVAVSSTAVVLRGLAARGELNAPHGRLAVGILVFQDLCVVPMILAVPFLAGEGGSTREVLITAAKAVAILAGVLVAASVVVPRFLAFIAETRQRDLFVLAVFLICLGTAWVVSLAGISLALGAFLAGLVVAGSEFRHQALSDLIPTREVFASLFFVSVGMLLDVSSLLSHWMETAGLLVAIVLGKSAIILFTSLALRFPLRVAILSAAALSQVGEFSFVLIDAASDTSLLGPELSQNLLVAIILSMLLTPLAIASGPHLASNAGRVPWFNRLLGADPPGVDADEPHSDHVIVAGYGLAGQVICRALSIARVPYVGVDVNPENVRTAKRAGDRVVLGDVTQREVLEELGVADARLVVLSINDPRATALAARTVRDLSPAARLLVRTQYQSDQEGFERLGATLVIADEVTASETLASACLDLFGESSLDVRNLDPLNT